ncbi:MAG: hypothetical protein GWN01_14605 [Nitrosopumilaceae archaeon]|nr:hypothetical protein [Nitrosopumilaceae archaeon]NIU88479.1 hypothetical protein [Nitrosopumilaceae archaeon]NIX62688.1 hypothetical protein [Nitrosopumilaceae archaeon]
MADKCVRRRTTTLSNRLGSFAVILGTYLDDNTGEYYDDIIQTGTASSPRKAAEEAFTWAESENIECDCLPDQESEEI